MWERFTIVPALAIEVELNLPLSAQSTVEKAKPEVFINVGKSDGYVFLRKYFGFYESDNCKGKNKQEENQNHVKTDIIFSKEICS